ncbi:nitrophenyl compound nitroreductase subunit ArsF family protein [Candidatus Bipolaricaulota bacterium]
MKIARIAVTVALLLFVGATVGMLIAQEVTHSEVAAVEGTESPPELAVETGSDVASQTSAETTEEAPATTGIDEPLPTQETAMTTEPDGSEETATAGVANVEGSAVSSCVVDAIYFHNTARCYTCKNIETTARAVLEVEFAGELTEGRLRWSTINMEKERQFVDLYSLVMPTLILVRYIDDEPQDWIALDETWSLIRYESRFALYVKDSTRAFLGGCP